MSQEHAAPLPLSITTKIGYGILLPSLAFLAYQFTLIETTRGDGSWAGITLFFGLAWIMPGLLLMNCWVIPLRWQQKRSVFFSGLILPFVIGIAELIWLHGSSEMAIAIQTVLFGSSIRIRLFILLLFAPLVASIAHAAMRRT